MRGSRLYILFMGAFLALVFLFEYMSPHEFVWKPTFNRKDREPFGSYVFDDVVSSSIDSYTVANSTFYQIFQEDSTASPRAFLITENALRFTQTDMKYLYKLLHAGNRVMICASSFPSVLEDTLCIEVEYDHYLPPINRYIEEDKKKDRIFFGRDILHPECIYEVYPQMHPVHIIPRKNRHVPDKSAPKAAGRNFLPACDSAETLVWNEDNKPLAIRIFIGKGELFLISTPLMFTNYGMLDGSNASYTFRLLSFMKGRPLMRIEAYGENCDEAQTPLRYVLSVPPLKWALYSILMLLILFMVFTARRRQRVIPVVTTPPNRALGFVQLISNLYYQKHENAEMLKMKRLYFCAEVKRQTGVDLQERLPDEAAFTRLSEKTGMDVDFIRRLIKNINMAMYRSEVSDIQLKQFIDGMNDIIHALKS
ncbi:MAG: DUF4350 domain-containing protein [Tannerella sp.]|nr:DUF4350 domain-containing protein [Tannerella sp.]